MTPTPKDKCCEFCEDSTPNGCTQPNCKCHSQAPELTADKIVDAFIETLPKRSAPPTAPEEKVESWAEEFDKKFVASITSSPGNIDHARAVIFFEDKIKIKSFIANLLHQREEELRKIVEREHSTCVYGDPSCACEDILSALSPHKGGNSKNL